MIQLPASEIILDRYHHNNQTLVATSLEPYLENLQSIKICGIEFIIIDSDKFIELLLSKINLVSKNKFSLLLLNNLKNIIEDCNINIVAGADVEINELIYKKSISTFDNDIVYIMGETGSKFFIINLSKINGNDLNLMTTDLAEKIFKHLLFFSFYSNTNFKITKESLKETVEIYTHIISSLIKECRIELLENEYQDLYNKIYKSILLSLILPKRKKIFALTIIYEILKNIKKENLIVSQKEENQKIWNFDNNNEIIKKELENNYEDINKKIISPLKNLFIFYKKFSIMNQELQISEENDFGLITYLIKYYIKKFRESYVFDQKITPFMLIDFWNIYRFLWITKLEYYMEA